MVFSQTSHKTQSVLKVVDIDRLKADKNLQQIGTTGVVTDGITTMPSSPVPTTSFSEEYLKPEPDFESTMFHESDCEFFQDLVQWCYAPAKEEHAQTIDSPPKNEEKVHTIDTLHTQFSPQGWEGYDGNSPTAQAGFYNVTPNDPLSPTTEGFLYPTEMDMEKKLNRQEQFLDISSLPVVIGDLSSERVENAYPWQSVEPAVWTNLHDTNYTKTYTNITNNTHNTLPYTEHDDSLDMKVSVIPRQVENNVVVSEYVLNEDHHMPHNARPDRGGNLSVNVTARAPFASADISTPEVLSYVEQLEKEKSIVTHPKPVKQWMEPEAVFVPPDTRTEMVATTPYEPLSPKSESHVESEDDVSSSLKRSRHDSEDSDETYTPYSEHTPRKYKRRKPNVPIKDMILALEGSQQLTKARRGRPPKRRESTVSSVCSIDDNSSTEGNKYRELRNKNNEASKRSRLNRKLKELQMEQLALELEDRNKKLQVRADILEDMTKRLKEALMKAILQK